MLSKRIIACLDVRNGKLAKSIKFVNTKDIGDPVAAARRYYEQGLDELVFYDITASSENRNITLDVVSRVAAQVFIPFSVGGGLRTVEDCSKVLLAGAEKVNLNTAAVQNPGLIAEASRAFGAQCVVLSMDIRAVPPAPKIPSGYEIVIRGGRTPVGIDAIEWAKQGESLGAGELVVVLSFQKEGDEGEGSDSSGEDSQQEQEQQEQNKDKNNSPTRPNFNETIRNNA